MEVISYIVACPGNGKTGNIGNNSSASVLLDDHLKTILENVRLLYLLEREGWDSTPNWEDVLSLGEQQRLGMVSINWQTTFICSFFIFFAIELIESRSLPFVRLVCFSIILSLVSSTSAPSTCSVTMLFWFFHFLFSFLIKYCGS